MYTDWQTYSAALSRALEKVKAFGPDVLIVSLGLDTFENDPISRFKLTKEDYLRMGAAIAGAKVPTLFAFEGGYDLSALAEITVNTLQGFEGG
jgi:acetoin utilization deacetylase AcuC-like enzyme